MVSITQYRSAEAVTEGHPDKICDQIADAVLDEYLAQDPHSRVACDILAAKELIVVAGEITSKASVLIEDIVRQVLLDIGYTDSKIGINGNTCKVITSISQQSVTIRNSIDISVEKKEGRVENDFDLMGAGDQSIVIGYACNESDVFMPLPIVLANRLARQLTEVRKDGAIPYLRPDGKTMVTVEYRNSKPQRVSSVVISAQHEPDVNQLELHESIYKHVVEKSIPANFLDSSITYFVNPSGPWTFGGPGADTGLTGRKVAVDTYGTTVRLGGGALSGKDPTKVDRSGAYAARHIAKNIVAAGLADVLEVEIGYAIGLASPLYVSVDTFGTEHVAIPEIQKLIDERFELRLAGILEVFKLQRPIYRKIATYGQMGREDIKLPWERIEERILHTAQCLYHHDRA